MKNRRWFLGLILQIAGAFVVTLPLTQVLARARKILPPPGGSMYGNYGFYGYGYGYRPYGYGYGYRPYGYGYGYRPYSYGYGYGYGYRPYGYGYYRGGYNPAAFTSGRLSEKQRALNDTCPTCAGTKQPDTGMTLPDFEKLTNKVK